jgi:hypothetical protein
MSSPFAQAVSDHHFEEQRGPLRYRDGPETEEHDVSGYLERVDAVPEFARDVDGPLLDMGAGAGRHARAFQEHVDTVAIEPSELLVDVMADLGVDDARVADMFDLRASFDRDTFGAAFSAGTQSGMAGSLQGFRAFLGDLASVTTPDAVAHLDAYDPRHERTRDLIGFREDAAGETAYRLVQYEYDGTLGRPWLFRLFMPDELRRATTGTGWDLRDLAHGDGRWDHTYNVTLEKA